MKNNIQVLQKTTLLGKELTVYGTVETPLFLAKDVAEWIEYDKSSINKLLSNVEEEEKVRNIIPTHGGKQEAWFLTEDGLYESLMQSRKPIAKQIKKGIKHVLKSIRKHGGYLTPDKIEEALTDPDTIIQLATNLKEERRQKELFARRAEEQEKQLKISAPKVEYHDKILQTESLISVNSIAKELGMSARRLNKILKENKIQYLSGGRYVLYQKYQDKGYTKPKTHTYTDSEGREQSRLHTYWTQKGRKFIHEVLKKVSYGQSV